MKILVVEDEGRISSSLEHALSASGYLVTTVGNGEEAWFLGDTEEYAAIVLDLGLPGMDGLSVLKKWRAAGMQAPVLILTARGSWMERVEGIDAGADDYLPKPFQMEELLARVRALLRRSAGHASPTISLGGIALDTKQMRASTGGLPLNLTPLEYRALSYLMHHTGQVVTQFDLSEHVYGHDAERESNAIEVLIGRLRRKIGVDAIKTRRGFGYIFEPPLEGEAR